MSEDGDEGAQNGGKMLFIPGIRCTGGNVPVKLA